MLVVVNVGAECKVAELCNQSEMRRARARRTGTEVMESRMKNESIHLGQGLIASLTPVFAGPNEHSACVLGMRKFDLHLYTLTNASMQDRPAVRNSIQPLPFGNPLLSQPFHPISR